MPSETKMALHDLSKLSPRMQDLVEVSAAQLFSLSIQQASQLLISASSAAQREVAADSSEITKATKIQVIHCLCEDGHITKDMRDEILQSLGFDEMDPV